MNYSIRVNFTNIMICKRSHIPKRTLVVTFWYKGQNTLKINLRCQGRAEEGRLVTGRCQEGLQELITFYSLVGAVSFRSWACLVGKNSSSYTFMTCANLCVHCISIQHVFKWSFYRHCRKSRHLWSGCGPWQGQNLRRACTMICRPVKCTGTYKAGWGKTWNLCVGRQGL